MRNERCIGFGELEDVCENFPDRAMNPSGLWCTRCETARRVYLNEQFDKVTQRFADEVGGNVTVTVQCDVCGEVHLTVGQYCG